MTVNVTSILNQKLNNTKLSFSLKEFKNTYWRLFEIENFHFLFVYDKDEIILFVAKKDEDVFYSMTLQKNETFIIFKNDPEFESCRKIICKEENWKKEVLLYRRSPKKIISGLCKACLLESDFKEIKCNHPSTFKLWKNILSIITEKKS